MPMHFDLICAPEHDYPSTKKPNNVHAFKGSLATTSLIRAYSQQRDHWDLVVQASIMSLITSLLASK